MGQMWTSRMRRSSASTTYCLSKSCLCYIMTRGIVWWSHRIKMWGIGQLNIADVVVSDYIIESKAKVQICMFDAIRPQAARRYVRIGNCRCKLSHSWLCARIGNCRNNAASLQIFILTRRSLLTCSLSVFLLASCSSSWY